jgi:hypothetical protein
MTGVRDDIVAGATNPETNAALSNLNLNINPPDDRRCRRTTPGQAADSAREPSICARRFATKVRPDKSLSGGGYP